MLLKINDKNVEVDRREYARDVVTRKHTAFASFHELINASGSYRPSVYMDDKSRKAQRELLFLTFEYNNYQKARNDVRRIYKADWAAYLPHRYPILNDHTTCAHPDCTEKAVGHALISINGSVKQHAMLCQMHLDVAKEDKPVKD